MAMAKGRFTKLTLGPAIEGKHRSVAGSIIIADYVDPVTAQRTLVLERVASDKKPATKPRKTKVNSPAPERVTTDTALVTANG
jgi:hypothetical protein